MTSERRDIEVEVLEIDGVAPVVPEARSAAEDARPRGAWQDWHRWPGQVRRLDSRWWPLWVVLGIIALLVVFTVGLVLGLLFLAVRLLLKIVRAIFG